MDIVLRWRLIHEYYGPGLEYIQGKNNIGVDLISRLTNTGNKNTTHESHYIMETVSEINDIKELSEGKFPIRFEII